MTDIYGSIVKRRLVKKVITVDLLPDQVHLRQLKLTFVVKALIMTLMFIAIIIIIIISTIIIIVIVIIIVTVIVMSST